jgi:hypothetical protein
MNKQELEQYLFQKYGISFKAKQTPTAIVAEFSNGYFCVNPSTNIVEKRFVQKADYGYKDNVVAVEVA